MQRMPRTQSNIQKERKIFDRSYRSPSGLDSRQEEEFWRDSQFTHCQILRNSKY
jgi:hypothetical protein